MSRWWRTWVGCVVLLALALGWAPQAAYPQRSGGGINKKSHNALDSVDIVKITPRVGSDLPTPCRLPFTLELSYHLRSAAKGRLRVGVFRCQLGAQTRQPAKGTLAPGLEALVKPVERAISRGKGVLTLSTEAVNLQPQKTPNSQVIVVVNMQDQGGQETCWATSYNFLRGTLTVRPDTAPARSDAIQVLSFEPKAGPLKTGHEHAFQVNLKYQLKSQPWGYLNLEIGEGSLQTGWTPWYTSVVPVTRGTGLLRIKTRPFFLPAVSAHKQLAMLLPFRIEPLGGTVQVLTGGPWPLLTQDGE